MSTKVILVVHGEPNSTFSEILFKYLKSTNFKKNKNKLVLIGSKKLILKQMRVLKYKFQVNEITNIEYSNSKLLNIINVDFKYKKVFSKINGSSTHYIEKCFDLAIKLIKLYKLNKLINGPVSKTHFLKKKFPGITEYIGNKININNQVMLIYNKKLAVSPLTTHIPIKDVSKYIKKKKIIGNVTNIHNFYKLKLKKLPKIAILGLNPHCESTDVISEEKKEIVPAIKYLKKNKIKVEGPFPADSFFLTKNIRKFDVVVGMYHDQVLIPAKTLFNFNAINVTIGLPFVKVTPDHGPNFEMIGKNKSDPSSFFYAIKFLENIK